MEIQKLKDKLGTWITDNVMLELALTHSSVDHIHNYEKLEFLGDSALALVMSELLIQRYKDENEGVLAKKRNILVSKDVLALVGQNLELHKFINAASNDIKNNPSVIADTVEAIIGAIYTVSGIEAVKDFIKTHWAGFIDDLHLLQDASKTILQEWSQRNNLGTPIYRVVASSGPSHLPSFTVEVMVGAFLVSATSTSKKKAEQEAAKALLEILPLQNNVI